MTEGDARRPDVEEACRVRRQHVGVLHLQGGRLQEEGGGVQPEGGRVQHRGGQLQRHHGGRLQEEDVTQESKISLSESRQPEMLFFLQ